MSPANKTKSQSAPQWCVINPNFALNESENQIINKHDAIWREHCSTGKPTDSLSVEMEYRSFENGAADGDSEALKMLQTFGTLEAFVRFRRAEQLGRRRRFDRENAALFVEVHPIAKRLREILEKLLHQYRIGGEDERRLLGLSPVLNDDATSLMERTIAGLFAVESHTPAAFEVMGNHVELTQIEEEQP
jgi:hypothetical protein